MADPTVQLYHSGAWHDLAVRVDPPLSITRTADVTPALCALTADNASGTLSTRVPTSPLYGLVGRNTPLRVVHNGATVFAGEVARWPTEWSVTGADVTAPVSAAGILRRLNQGAKALRPALHRAVMATSPLAYWPMEDGRDVTLSRSPVEGVAPLVVGPPVGLNEPGSYVSFDATPGMGGTGKLVDFVGGGQLTAQIPPQASTSIRLEAVVAFTTGEYNAIVAMLLADFHFTDGTVFRINHNNQDLYLEYTNPPSFSFSELTFTDVNLYDGRAHHVRVDATQDGADIDIVITIDGVVVATDTWTGRTLSTLTHVVLNEGNGAGPERPSLSNVAVWAPWAGSVDTAAAATGWAGESAGRRIERLCDEAGITFVGTGDLDVTAVMSPQGTEPFVALLGRCATADQGLLYELRDQLGIGYRTLDSLYNQTPVELGYAHIAPPMWPPDDDTAVRNDVTVTRPDGGSHRVTQDTGPLSTQDPPSGVGAYDPGPTEAHVYDDAQLPHIAGWLLHVGTCDDLRYPSITFDMAAPVWDSDPALAAAVAALDIGDVISIADPPTWLPPDPILAMVVRIVDTHHPAGHRVIEVGTVPARTHTVGVLDDDELGRLDTSGTELTGALTATATSFAVTVTDGPAWTSTDVPFDIAVGGERIRVTAHAAGTFTVTRAVNGVVKAHAAGTAVCLWTPLTLAY